MCMRLRLITALAFFVLLRPDQLPAQTGRVPKNPEDQKLVAISVTGTSRFTPDEIIAASGLRIGAPATDDDFKKVVEQLGDSGLFADASYSYSFSPAGTKLALQLADKETLVPVRFENFVWLSDEDLLRRLREHLPLFKGQAPAEGSLADRISDVLQAILLEHASSGVVDYVRVEKDNGPVEALVYRATNVTIRVRHIEFPGATADELPALTSGVATLIDRSYVRSDFTNCIETRLRPIYLQRGFLNASFAEPRTSVVHESADETLVDVALPVQPGPQYKLAGMEWAGNKAFPAAKLQSLITLPPGQPVNANRLNTDLNQVRKLYGTQGYMEASVDPEPEFDDAAGTVLYRLKVSEGEVFRMGDLDIRGLDPRVADHLEQGWKLRPGDPYDQSYPDQFADESLKRMASNMNWSVTVHEAVNGKDKTVDVTLNYTLSVSR
jgi:outer membrane protein assembly factor BamA